MMTDTTMVVVVVVVIIYTYITNEVYYLLHIPYILYDVVYKEKVNADATTSGNRTRDLLV